MKRIKWLPLFALLLVLLTLPVHAQDSTARDPQAMAQRWLGWPGGPAIGDLSPAYEVGDTAQFWVSKAGKATPTEITATLAAQTSFLELWVEEGLPYAPAAMELPASNMMYASLLFRDRVNLGGITAVPETLDDIENADKLAFADIDGNEALTIVFARDLNTTHHVLYNPVNNQPEEWVANGWTNESAVLFVNTSASPALELNDPSYSQFVARAIFNALVEQNNPSQTPWLRDAQSWYMVLNLFSRDITPADFQTFFSTPDLPLTSDDTERSAITAAGQIFLRYVEQRFGGQVLREWFSTSGSGFDQLTTILADHGITDLVTDEPITGQDVFADWAMANVLNSAVGDTRYVYTHPAAEGLSAAAPGLQDQFDFQVPNLSVSQYGSSYVVFSATQPADFQLAFNGATTVNRLPMTGDSGNHFYWSGNSLYQNTAISQTFDLTGVQSATLTFDVWHQLAEGWNYGYVSVSEDGGNTFKPLVSSGVTTTNPYGLSYGPAFTGVSNPQPSRPFPYLGIGLEPNGITISSIAENSPLAELDVQVGDTIAGYDGQLWQGKADITAYLSSFQPGDVVDLYMQRGEAFFSLKVVLGTHPSRVIPAEPIWTPQEVNLNAYAGKQIVLRFDYVSADDRPDKGMAIDNIAIPEIGFSDDAESGIRGWAMNGWQQIDNVVPQQYIVQYALLGEARSRVERLIAPGDDTTSGVWTFSLNAEETVVLAISGINDLTDTPATFALSAQTLQTAPQNQARPTPAAEPTAESPAV
ncbi:MAG: immune inhibitor A [Chloroflexi bacterium]|nr:immune inhibitor A [Chloroflexota bacterium]MCC6895867.1 immune inhibitor A [Anaerolineae bacterium]